MNLIRILFRPGATVGRLRVSQSWMVPFCLLAAGHVVLLFATSAGTMSAVLAHLPPTATGAEREAVRGMLSADLLSRAILLPLRLLTGWSSFGLLLWFLLRSTRPEHPVGFRRMFQLEVHAEIALLLGAIAAALVPRTGGDPARFAPFWSLASFSPDAPFPLFILLRDVNIFTLWYAAILAVGIHVLSNQNIRISALVAAGACVLTTLFDAGVLTLLIEQLHLSV
jgi:hypothetical protein